MAILRKKNGKKKLENSTDSDIVRRQHGKVFHTYSIHRKEEKMHTISKSLKVAAGALTIALAILGLTACGSGGNPAQKMQRLSLMPGTSISHSEVGDTVK
ncbi:hypothetical protein [Mycobacterium sp.]|uniref:hypothetical protein n=2 Tax=Mycobacterium sp. TaxID=1785 RepID=UPI003C795473